MKRFIGAVSFAVLFLSCFIYGVEPATKYQPQYMQNWSWDETRQAFNVCSLQNSTNTFVALISSAPGGLNVFINTNRELSVIASSNSIIKQILTNVGVYTSINSTNVSNVMISSAQGGVNVKINDDKEISVIISTNSNIKAILDGVYVTTIAPVEQRGQWAVSVTSGAIRNTQENGAVITVSSIVADVPIKNGAQITVSSIVANVTVNNGLAVTVSSITANVGVYVTTAAPILDYDFQNMVSTQIAGKINTSSNFTPDLTVKSYSFIFVGSTGTLSGGNMGDLPLIDGMSINQTFVRARPSQLFQIGLAADSTMYYIINGGK